MNMTTSWSAPVDQPLSIHGSGTTVPTWPGQNSNAALGTAAADSRSKPTSPRVLRALLFEFDNVICDATIWQRWLWQLLSRLGVQRDFQGFANIWQRGYLIDVQCGRREFAEAFRTFLIDWGLSTGQIDEVEAASAARRREMCQHARPLPGVLSTLSELHSAGLTLGILADSELSAIELAERIDRQGMAGRFQLVLSSRDLGCVKPNAACYQTALDLLRLPPTSVAFIGSVADDLAGAANVGLRTIGLNADDNAHTQYPLHRFDELRMFCAPGLPAPGGE